MTRVTPSMLTGPGVRSTQARTWIREGLGQIIPKNRMIAPASPAPVMAVLAESLILLGMLAGLVKLGLLTAHLHKPDKPPTCER